MSVSERTGEKPDNETRVRVTAQLVGSSLLRGSNQALAEAGLDVARLTAGLDPGAVDTTSPAYLFGASDALSGAVSRVGEAIPDQRTLDFLADVGNAKILTKVASRPSITAWEIIDELGQVEEEVPAGDRFNGLSGLGLIEPALPEQELLDKTWRLSPWGKQTYLRLYREIAQSAGFEPMVHGLRGLLAQSETSE